MLQRTFSAWLDWWDALPATWAFLLLLPFAVAAIGLAESWIRRRGADDA